jgi:hypothetical protein
MLVCRDRLLECFRVLFSHEPDVKLLNASQENLETWGSTQHLTLLILVK